MHKIVFFSISVVLIVVGCGVIDDQRKVVAEGYVDNFREKNLKRLLIIFIVRSRSLMQKLVKN